MSIWLYLNIFVVLAVIFSLIFTTGKISLPVLFGLVGLLFIMYNWTRHAFFSTIRNTTDRQKKIRLATISKKVLPYHRWTGTTALVLILFHLVLMIERYGFISTSYKMWSGLFALIVLAIMVTTGWLRLYFPSGKKRKAHLWTGFILFFIIVIHTLIF